jgi:mannosyltransferase
MINVFYDNIIFNLQKSGGISVYWKELIERIQKDNLVSINFLEYNNSEKNIFRKDLIIDKNSIKKINPFLCITLVRYLNPRVKVNKKTIFHSSYYRTSKGKNIKNIVTVHDFTYEKEMKTLIGKIHTYQKKKALINADGIVCISENTKKDMLQIYPKLKNKKIIVIYNGFSSDNYVYKENLLFESSVLFVGARKGYKNFDKAVEVVKEINDVTLSIVGPPLTNDEKLFLDNVIPNRYKSFSHISNEELSNIYNKSICLLYLSEYEGFGIPVLEAMSSGCPVVALNKSSIPEVAGDAGILFTEFDKTKIKETVEFLRYNQDLRFKQINLGLINVKKFSWDKCYKELVDFYNEVL